MVVCFDDGAAIRVVAAADRRSIIGIGRERDETEQNFIVMKRQSSKDMLVRVESTLCLHLKSSFPLPCAAVKPYQLMS